MRSHPGPGQDDRACVRDADCAERDRWRCHRVLRLRQRRGAGLPIRDAFGEFDETIAEGAFKKTLRDGCDVAFLCNHSGVTMARTKPGSLRLSSDKTGLLAEARLNPERSDVQIVRAAVEDGALDEMCFAFVTTRQEWSESYSQRRILEVSLSQGDVSICNYGANGHTAGLVSVAPAATNGGQLAQIYNLASHSRIARARLALGGRRSGRPKRDSDELVRRSRELVERSKRS